jgi:ParB family chromosome partitioning protein
MRKLENVDINLIESVNVVCDKCFLKSIKDKGVIEPVVLGWNNSCDGYVIKDGKRRVFAARNAELKTVPAVIDDEVDNSEAVLITNLLRSHNLGAEVKALRKLINSGQNTLNEISDILSIPLSALKKTARLLNLSDKSLEALESGRVWKGAAFTLSSLSKEEQDRLISSTEGKIVSGVIEKAKREVRIKNTVANLLSDIAGDTEDNNSSLSDEFESVVSKIMVGDVPQSLKDAVNIVREFIRRTNGSNT